MNYVYSPALMWVSNRRLASGKKVSKRAQATFEGAMNMIALPTVFTMFLAGIWHGAGFQYILFGLLHGIYLTGNHLWRTFLPAEGRIRQIVSGPLAIGLTFLSVLVAQVLFRAPNVGSAIAVYAGMIGLHGKGALIAAEQHAKVCLVLTFFIVWLLPNTQEILGEEQKEDSTNWSLVRVARWRPNLVWWVVTFSAFLFALSSSSAESTFLYFQF
jgi:D-alanyl-lipoteichoic acid acyltransferase DltB (MBOAT superfamily)